MAKNGPKASKSVERAMHEFKEGRLKSGSGKRVTNPKQAVAIGLSEARESGARVAPKANSGTRKDAAAKAPRNRAAKAPRKSASKAAR